MRFTYVQNAFPQCWTILPICFKTYANWQQRARVGHVAAMDDKHQLMVLAHSLASWGASLALVISNTKHTRHFNGGKALNIGNIKSYGSEARVQACALLSDE